MDTNQYRTVPYRKNTGKRTPSGRNVRPARCALKKRCPGQGYSCSCGPGKILPSSFESIVMHSIHTVCTLFSMHIMHNELVCILYLLYIVWIHETTLIQQYQSSLPTRSSYIQYRRYYAYDVLEIDKYIILFMDLRRYYTECILQLQQYAYVRVNVFFGN